MARFASAMSSGGLLLPGVIRSSSFQPVQRFENGPRAAATVSVISARASTGRFGRLYPATHATPSWYGHQRRKARGWGGVQKAC